MSSTISPCQLYARALFGLVFSFNIATVVCLDADDRSCQNGECTISDDYAHPDWSQFQGHLGPFGSGIADAIPIDEINEWCSVQTFLSDYVLPRQPLVFRGAAKLSPGFQKWTDEYFLDLEDVPRDNQVLVETVKKEDRGQNTLFMNFLDFVASYNASGLYMVDTVPEFIRDDLIIPWPLQCDQLYEQRIVNTIMWFSSGGTKSVVHTDSVDNINCIYRGQKEFVMVDPMRFGHLVDIDHPEGAYSSVDVDRVDYSKFPGLAETEYNTIKLEAGDCIYIPYKWIHQVRSFDSNIAVNIWWDAHGNQDIDMEDCPFSYDPLLTMSHVILHSSEEGDSNNVAEIKDEFLHFVTPGPKDFNAFLGYLVPEKEELDEMKVGIGYLFPIKKMFALFDVDRDGRMTLAESKSLPEEAWETVREELQKMDLILAKIEEEIQRLDDEPGHWERYPDGPSDREEL
ncbi:hypothetical protein CAPTEDRAFT_207894 [Capitella teleta]|uniref:JmjC domain-containing protein n=1 Tax=Capitella teleta TaxID=283909 RepID=R7VG85_CAPTE|nr:hypothetical protein CAPTEDRAFT_207894 [Capitella teleta]|eukprot:ELU17587.1 hypothetical protein CAPTEDRAFT_207894 [Capitella teleta]